MRLLKLVKGKKADVVLSIVSFSFARSTNNNLNKSSFSRRITTKMCELIQLVGSSSGVVKPISDLSNDILLLLSGAEMLLLSVSVQILSAANLHQSFYLDIFILICVIY